MNRVRRLAVDELRLDSEWLDRFQDLFERFGKYLDLMSDRTQPRRLFESRILPRLTDGLWNRDLDGSRCAFQKMITMRTRS
jgi:hypothetical protein